MFLRSLSSNVHSCLLSHLALFPSPSFAFLICTLPLSLFSPPLILPPSLPPTLPPLSATSVTLNPQQADVLTPFFELRDDEDSRQKTSDSLRRNDLSEVHQQWRNTRRFFTGERGVWSNRCAYISAHRKCHECVTRRRTFSFWGYRKAEQFLWKLSKTENYSRMRMKLAKLYTRDFHQEAARLRDQVIPMEGLDCMSPVVFRILPPQDSSQQTVNLEKADKTLLAKATRTGTMQMDYDDFLDTLPPAGPEGQSIQPEEEAKEKLVRTEKCDLILLMERVSGRLEVTTHNLYFFADHNEKKENNLGELHCCY